MSVNVVTVVQARTGSTRLPGKVLALAGGRPVLETQVTRMARSQLAGTIAVATTTDPADDPILAICRPLGIQTVRGHSTDLLDRHLQTARELGGEVVVKVPSDCPLIDPEVIDQVIAAFLSGGHDYVSNLHPPTWPDGQDVEVLSRDVLEEAHRQAVPGFEREHTTPYVWERPERYRLANVGCDRDLSAVYRLTLDYPEDLALIDAVLNALTPDAGVAEIVEYLSEHPEINDLNAAYRGVNWYRHHLDQLQTVSHADTRFAPGEDRR